ncbi:MAG: serine hydrolase [Actinophytocola sp.]|nr:serine hydrolase [Actinophytocola sp.]
MMSGIERLVRARGGSGQVCVIRDGDVVLDLAVGCAPDDLFWTFSAGKPYVALLVHQLAERGALDLDDPVATHWPDSRAAARMRSPSARCCATGPASPPGAARWATSAP